MSRLATHPGDDAAWVAGAATANRNTHRAEQTHSEAVSEFDSTDLADTEHVATNRRVRPIDLLMVTSQLSIMCRSGIDLAEALRGTAAECRHAGLKSILTDIYQNVSRGKSVSVAMSDYKDVFGEAYIASISAAEASGTMGEVLPRLTDLLRNEIRLRSTLKATLAYPVILLLVAISVVTALVLFVLPQFEKVFQTLERPAPPLTTLLLESAAWIRGHIFYLLAAAGAAVFFLIHSWRQPASRRFRDRCLLVLPVFRSATQPLLTGRAFRLMGTLLATGVPLLEAVKLCRRAVSNSLFQDLFYTVEKQILSGQGLARAFSSSTFIPGGASQMIATAEKTGRLDTVLQLIGEFYEDEGERQLRQVVKLMEPIIIVLMGIIVASVVLAVMLPLLDVSAVG